MKKILSILILFVAIGVKGQIVGGYITSTSTNTLTNKTISNGRLTGTTTVTGPITGTASNVTFSNIIAGGTQSVVGNSTLANVVSAGTASFGSGTSTFSNVLVGGTFSATGASTVNGFTNLGNGITVGTSSVGSTLKVTGASTLTGAVLISGALTAATTMSLGAANLTGGNTGTVAVLSDVPFNVNFNATTGSSPADATTYYIGNTGYLYYSGGAALARVLLPYNCTLVGWSYSNINNGVNGSAETATLSVRANNSTDTQLSTTINYSTSVEYTASGLSTSFTAGDMINIKIVTPTWVTNPTGIFTGITLWFVRRT